MTKKAETEEDKIWENLKKEYLTIDQKLDIIRDFNFAKSNAEWNKSIAAIRDYLEKQEK